MLGRQWWCVLGCWLSMVCVILSESVWAEPAKTESAKTEPVTVVTSIRPVQWIVQALLPPDIDVVALLPPGQSMHEYTLRPADMVRIQQSSLLVWTGPGMEPWLAQIASRLPSERVLAILPASETDEHGHSTVLRERVSAALAADAHFWLDPMEMVGVTDWIASGLAKALPAQADGIRQRLPGVQQAMQQLDNRANQVLAPVRQRGFVVYHDSYGRLVSRYRLNQLAAVWHHEALPAGVKERAALLSVLRSGQVSCVFHEPEYGEEAVTGWLSSAATGVRVQVLDPLGGRVTGSGLEAYTQFFETMVHAMAACLSGASPDDSTITGGSDNGVR